jgi:hypothetical protein
LSEKNDAENVGKGSSRFHYELMGEAFNKNKVPFLKLRKGNDDHPEHKRRGLTVLILTLE